MREKAREIGERSVGALKRPSCNFQILKNNQPMPTTKLPLLLLLLLLLLLAATVGQACLSPLTADNVTALGRSWGLVYQGVAAGSLVGARVQTAGDVNGDGFEDFLVAAATSIGDVFLVFGRADFEAASLVLTTEDSTPDAADWVKFEGNAGVSITTTSFTSGDFNGDGVCILPFLLFSHSQIKKALGHRADHHEGIRGYKHR